MMKNLNLTEIVLRNRQTLVYFMVSILVAGVLSYTSLGRMEDPDFVIRQMVISVAWPGADTGAMQNLVLDKMERQLQQTRGLKTLTSRAEQGRGTIYITLAETFPADQVRAAWKEVRNLTGDIKGQLPLGVVGPFFNDGFDDIFGSIYALTGDDFSPEDKRREAENIRRRFLRIEDVSRVELIGVQEEKIYLEIDPVRLAALGISPMDVRAAVSGLEGMLSAGMIETESDNVFVRVSGMYGNLDDIGNIPLEAGGRVFRISDVAAIEKRYAEPQAPIMLFNGKEAIGIAVSMERGANNIRLGEDLAVAAAELRVLLPLGLELFQAADQPQVVQDSIREFMRSILEAVAILLVVSLISLGVRTGLVVSLCIPLVFAGVFVVMRVMGIDLHTVSLGTLIIALGLLVDDEIIAVEMMSVKLEEGLTRFEAACSAYRITAMPMLSGTLITCAGFIPIGFARGATAEFTAAMFPVLAASLLISWLVSVTAAPFLGYMLIRSGSGARDTPRSIRGDSLGKRFLAAFRCFLVVALRHRNTVIAATAVCFVLSVLGMAYVRAEFFPPSRRGEVIVDLTLPAGSSLQSIREAADKFSRVLDREEGILHYSGHIGEGAPRFVSAYAPTEPATNFAQFIVLAESAEARRSLEIRLRKKLNLDFPELKSVIRVLNMGPPSPYPVMLRVSGPRPDELRKIASQIAGLLRSDDTYVNVGFDWGERARTVRLVINPERLAVLGATRQSVAQSLHVAATGFRVGELYQGDRNLEIVFRLGEKHITLDELENIPVSLASGGSVPLAQLARLEYASEEVSTWRRDLEPCITVHAEIVGGTSSDATQKAYTLAAPIWESLPPGYDVRIGGDLENSQNSSRYLLEPIPLMLFAIFTLLMLQLKRFSLAILALSSAPLGLIGISAALLITDMPMGFVAQIGIIALIGMLIRNAVILLDQIDRHIKEGQSAWEAVINSAALRFRPIMLTALTAVLAMIPLMLNNFWGPLAVSLSGGLMVGTALTLIVLPCLYAAWFRVREFE